MLAAHPSVEPLHGVSLSQYAGVAAALVEGFPLADILANEQLAPAVWPRAEMAWKARVARDGAEGPIFADLREKRAVAEDCLAREVAPIDTDLGAWMSFLRAYGAHPAPAQMLEGAGLGVNDLSRLQRRWARRMAEDEALAKQAAELARKGLGPLPALRVGRAALARFPWSKGPAPEVVPVAPRVAAPAETSLSPGKLALFSYVVIKARLAESRGKEQEVLEELGLREFAATDAGWQTVLRGNPELQRDYLHLLGLQRAKLHVTGKKAAPVPRTPSAEGSPTPAAPWPRAVVRPVPAELAGTSLPIDVPHKPALPFAEGAVLPATAARPAQPAQRPDFSGTALALDLPLRGTLPFPEAPSASPALPVAPAQPAPAGVPSGGPPLLTLEQHASLSCEIAEAPERALEALARYRITPAEKQAVDRHYAEQFAREPGARSAWEEAYRKYRGWWLAYRLNR